MIAPQKRTAASDVLSGLFSLALAAFVMAVLYLGRELLIPVALAILLTFLLSPLVSRLERFLGKIFSVAAVVLLIFALVAGVCWSITRQVIDLGTRLPDYQLNIASKLDALHVPDNPQFDRLSAMISQLQASFTGQPVHLDAPRTRAAQRAARGGGGAAANAVPVTVVDPAANSPIEKVSWITKPLLDVVVNLGIVLLLAIFMLLHRQDLRARLIRLVGQGHISETTRALDEAGVRVARYLRMQLLINCGFGLALGCGLTLIGVPNASLWGAFAAVLRFVPYVGIWLAATFPIVLSLAVTPDWMLPVLTVTLFAVLELVSSNLIEPFLYRSSTGVSSLALIFAAIFWTWLWGPVGLLLATPMTVCVVVMGRHAPRLAFLSVMFGDDEPLTPAEDCYHRLLTGDLNDATGVIDTYSRQHSVTALYDHVLLPAVTAAERDLRRGALEEKQRAAVLQGVRDLIQEVELRPRTPSKLEADRAVAAQSVGLATPACRVLCIPSRGDRDEIAGLMLAHLLRTQGFAADGAAVRSLAVDLDEIVTRSSADAVCISVIPPSTVIHARYLCTRLRAKFPKLKIVVGVWGATENLDEAALGLRERGADEVVVSLAEAVVQLGKFSTALETPMQPGAIPADETQRLVALAASRMLEKPGDPVFDRITRNLARIFDVPIALLTFIDSDRQLFKSQVGLPEDLVQVGQVPRQTAICSHVVASNAPLVVEDLARDHRFANNPMLKSRGLRFYAGVPLHAPNGQPIGALCIIDTKPRQFDDAEKRLLSVMADEVGSEIARQMAAAGPAPAPEVAEPAATPA